MDDIPTTKLIKAFIADMDPFTKKLIKVFIATVLIILFWKLGLDFLLQKNYQQKNDQAEIY